MVVVLAAIGALLLTYIVVVALFERLAPRPWVRAYQRVNNRLFARWTGFAHGWAIVETTGRRTGLPRRTPVGGRLRRDVWWCVAGDASHSSFVRNIEADQRVRVQVHGRWRVGTAHLLHDDDARRRLWRLNPVNSLFVAIAARDPLTIRIELEPVRRLAP